MFAFAFIFTGAICLASCGNNKEFSELIIEINGTEYQTSYNFGDFECDTTPNITYKVYAKYTDGSKEEFNNTQYSTAYKLNGQEIESLPETFDATNVGIYNIDLSYEHFTFNIYFNIVYASTTYQTSPLSKTEWAYGEEQPELSLVDNTIELNENCYKYIRKSDVTNPNLLTTEEINNAIPYSKDSPLDPGEYYLFIMVPQTGIYAETTSALLSVKVNKMQLVAEYSNLLKITYDYNNIWGDDGHYLVGNFKIQTENPQLSEPIEIKTQNGELIQIVGWSLDIASDAEFNSTNDDNQLTLNFNFYEGNESYAEYYILPNAVSVTLEVIKGQFEKPNIREYTDPFDTVTPNKIDIYVGGENSSTNNYNWSMYVLTVTKVGETTETIDINSVNSENMTHIYLNKPTEQGTYTYTVSLKDTTNYTWKDGTTNEVSFTITID